MIRLPILKDELAFLEKLLPDLETRPDLGHLAGQIKERIEKIRQEIRSLECVFRRCGWSIPAPCEWSFRPCE